MNTSTNEAFEQSGGAFADGLTFIRFALTPVIMAVIVFLGWPNNLDASLLASALFAIAALTDLFDDITGGDERSAYRRLGWFDDMADTVLIVGALLAISWVMQQAGFLNWLFYVPVGVIIAREIILGVFKGRQFRTHGWPESRLRTFKTALMMLATCCLIASPWLTTIYDRVAAGDESIMQIYNTASPYIWWIGLILLWVSAALSLLTGFSILLSKTDTVPTINKDA